jgi:ABC-type transport system substrate-binding protein
VIVPKPVITMLYIGFNLSKAEFTDRRVRQALSMAIDRKGIVDKILGGFATVADSPMAVGTFGYSPSPTYGFDPAKAKAVLTEAGWTPGPGGIVRKNGEPLKFVLWTPQNLYLKDVAVAQAAQAEMRAVGADVDLKVVEAANWFTTLRVPAGQAPYDMFMWSLTPTTGDGFQQLNELSRSDPDLSKPPSDWNLTHYINPKVDELIRLAGTTTDQSKRKEALKEAQRIIMADAPLVFMYSLDFVMGYKANLTGVRLLPNRFMDLREAQRIK